MALITERTIKEASQDSGGPADQVIKPLAWRVDEEGDWRADTAIGDYVVLRTESGDWAAEVWHGPAKRGDTLHIARSDDPERCKRMCGGYHKLLVGMLLDV
jgi:hypothetical protein